MRCVLCLYFDDAGRMAASHLARKSWPVYVMKGNKRESEPKMEFYIAAYIGSRHKVSQSIQDWHCLSDGIPSTRRPKSLLCHYLMCR